MEESKQCRQCGEVRPMSQYNKTGQVRKDGSPILTARCQTCLVQNNRERRHRIKPPRSRPSRYRGDLAKCSWCGVFKPWSDFELYVTGNQVGKPKSWCRECHNIIRRDKAAQERDLHFCRVCKIYKPSSAFYAQTDRRNRNKVHVRHQCKECERARRKELYRKQNPDTVRQNRSEDGTYITIRDKMAKWCPYCEQYKFVEEFGHRKTGHISSYCKSCDVDRQRLRRGLPSLEVHPDPINPNHVKQERLIQLLSDLAYDYGMALTFLGMTREKAIEWLVRGYGREGVTQERILEWRIPTTWQGRMTPLALRAFNGLLVPGMESESEPQLEASSA